MPVAHETGTWLSELSTYQEFLHYQPITLEMCLPAACTATELTNAANQWLRHRRVPIKAQFVRHSNVFETAAIHKFSCTCVIILIGVLVISSISRSRRCCLAYFNIGDNAKTFVTAAKQELDFLAGIRLIYAVNAIYGHWIISILHTPQLFAQWPEYVVKMRHSASYDLANSLPYSTSVNFVMG